jgi:hypothetical protein
MLTAATSNCEGPADTYDSTSPWNRFQDADLDVLMRLVAGASVMGFVDTMNHLIKDASPSHVAEILCLALHSAPAVRRICDTDVVIDRPDKVLERAAAGGFCASAVAIIDGACTIFEIEQVFSRLVRRGNTAAVLTLANACASSQRISPPVYARLVDACATEATTRGMDQLADDLTLQRTKTRSTSVFDRPTA